MNTVPHAHDSLPSDGTPGNMWASVLHPRTYAFAMGALLALATATKEPAQAPQRQGKKGPFETVNIPHLNLLSPEEGVALAAKHGIVFCDGDLISERDGETKILFRNVSVPRNFLKNTETGMTTCSAFFMLPGHANDKIFLPEAMDPEKEGWSIDMKFPKEGPAQINVVETPPAPPANPKLPQV